MNERECPCCGELGVDCNCKAESTVRRETYNRSQARIAALEADNRRLREACRQAFKMLVRSEGAGAAEAEQVLGAAMEGKP